MIAAPVRLLDYFLLDVNPDLGRYFICLRRNVWQISFVRIHES